MAARPGTPAVFSAHAQRPATPMVQPDSWMPPQGFAELEHRGWHFRSRDGGVGRPSKEVEIREPRPGTMYGESFLELEYLPSAVRLRFDCPTALQHWGDADDAIAAREGGEAEYRGNTEVGQEQPEGSALGKVVPGDIPLPVERYLAHDQVLFYDDVLLYDDRHGADYVQLRAKIRVMPDRFLVLLRLYQHRSGKGVRLVDTRYAHEFGENVVIADTEVRCPAQEEIAASILPGSAMTADAAYEMFAPIYRVDEKYCVE